jgi:ABC-type amino acid transport substrate-binding protein
VALIAPAIVFVAIAYAGQRAHGYFAAGAVRYGTFTLDPATTAGVRATIYRTEADFARSADAKAPARNGAAAIGRIQQTGVLRVGYNPSVIPFCYLNEAGELVGYDVAYAYDLARALNVRLAFVPFAWPSLEQDLIAGRFDVAMSGIYATTRRLSVLSASAPYYQSPLALFMPSDRVARFRTREQILAAPNLRIGVFDDPVLRPLLARLFPGAEVVVVPDYKTLPDFSRVDAAVWSLEQAGALARANPGITAVVPTDLGNPFLLSYLLPPGSEEMVHFVNYWLELRKASGFHALAFRRWILGDPHADATPRWSIARDVLGWRK